MTSTEADHRTAYTSPEVTHLPGSFQAPAMHVLFITTQLYIWEDFLKPGRTDDVVRVVRQLVIQRIGTAVAHDRFFRKMAEHPRYEQRRDVRFSRTWRHRNSQPANNTRHIRFIYTSESISHLLQEQTLSEELGVMI